jgi:hypothetical protein
MEGVVKEVVPLPPLSTLPPLEAAYQSTVSPAPAVAEIETAPVPQSVPPFPDGVDGKEFIVAVTAVRPGEIQPVLMFLDCA